MKLIFIVCLLLIFYYFIGTSFGNKKLNSNQQQKQQQIINQKDQDDCLAYFYIVGLINEGLREIRTEDQIIKKLKISCDFISEDEVCEQIIVNNGSLLVDFVRNSVGPSDICSMVDFCAGKTLIPFDYYPL
ncbi:hypothetical protein ACTFIY_008079 [Dictyostelium cf. discoideum]